MKKLTEKPADYVFIHSSHQVHSYFVIPPQNSPPTVILYVHENSTLPVGDILDDYSSELPLNTPIRFRPTRPFPACQKPPKYIGQGMGCVKRFLRGEVPVYYDCLEIAIVIYTPPCDFDAAKFVASIGQKTIACTSTSTHSKESINCVEVNYRRLNVKGLHITQDDLVVVYDKWSERHYIFPTTDWKQAMPIVLLISPNGPFPSGEIVGSLRSTLPAGKRIPFRPDAPIPAKMMYKSDFKHSNYQIRSFDSRKENVPETFNSRTIFIIITDLEYY